jgi:hypothetical protein
MRNIITAGSFFVLTLSFASCRDDVEDSVDNQNTSTSGGDGASSETPYDTSSESIDLGDGLVFSNIEQLSIGYHADMDDVCKWPSEMWFVTSNQDDYPRLNVYIPFVDSPTGSYTVGETISGHTGYGADNIGNYTVNISIDNGDMGDISIAESGVIDVVVDLVEGTASLNFSDVSFSNYSSSTTFSGDITVDILVYCFTLSEYPEDTADESGCGWSAETNPYISDFCVESTADYSADVLN